MGVELETLKMVEERKVSKGSLIVSETGRAFIASVVSKLVWI